MKYTASHTFDSRAHVRALARVWIVTVALCAVAAASPVGAEAVTAKKPAVAPPESNVRTGAATTAVPAAMRKETVRTLEAIHIEGEVAVPQVLFITARDVRRFRDGLGSKYQRSATDVAQSVSPPHRLRVVARHELNQ